MIGTLRSNVIAFGVAVFTAPLLLASPADAQQNGGRYEVVIPDFQRTDDARGDFGEDAANRLRDLIDDLDTHRPVDRDDIEDALDRFDTRMSDLNCVLTRQLTSQIGAQVAACIEYSSAGGDQVEVAATFVDVASGEAFEIEPFAIRDRDDRGAAQRIFDAFAGFVEQSRASAFCRDYASSSLWDSAEEQCLRSIELNPEAEASLYTLARVYMEQEEFEESLERLEQLLEVNPSHENGLNLAGFVAAQLGREEEARQYYTDYLQWNPENAQVRIRVAYDLAQAGDPLGALQLIERGIQLDSANTDLYLYRGNFAFSAGEQARREAGTDSITAEVEELYRTALGAYERVLEDDSVEVVPSQLRNASAAYLQLGEEAEAARFARTALDEFPEDASLWSVYAEALRAQDRIEDALAALDTAQSVDPDYPNVAARQGRWLLDAGRIDEAVPYFRRAVERGEQTPDAMANTVFSVAHSQGVQRGQYSFALRLIGIAKDFDVGAETREQLDFWHGYSLLQRGIGVQEPQNVSTARQALPMFQQARRLLQASQGYARRNNINVQQLLSATDQYIDIQEAVIRRGR